MQVRHTTLVGSAIHGESKTVRVRCDTLPSRSFTRVRNLPFRTLRDRFRLSKRHPKAFRNEKRRLFRCSTNHFSTIFHSNCVRLHLTKRASERNFFLGRRKLGLRNEATQGAPKLPAHRLCVYPRLRVFPFHRAGTSQPSCRAISKTSLAPSGGNVSNQVFRAGSGRFRRSQRRTKFCKEDRIPRTRILPQRFPIRPDFQEAREGVVATTTCKTNVLPNRPNNFVDGANSCTSLELTTMVRSRLVP